MRADTVQYIAGRALALLLCLCLLLGMTGCKKGSDAPLSPGLSVIEGVPVYEKDVAMRTDHLTVTPGMMAYFFYSYGATVMAQMEQQKAYDSSKRLHDQMYTDTLSWYDVIMNETLAKVSDLLIYCEAAIAAGVTLSESEQQEIADSMTAYRMQAVVERDMELTPYLQTQYGPLMTEQDLLAVLELETLAGSYSLTVRDSLEQGITASQVREYLDKNGPEDKTPSRNIAYLFVPYVNGSADEDTLRTVTQAMQASPTAETLLAQGEHGTPGTEENLTPDNSGIKQIGAWLFATGRSIGDWERIDLGGATYVLIYTGNGMSFGEVSARMALFDSAYATWYNTWVAQLQFGYNYDCLDGYDVQ